MREYARYFFQDTRKARKNHRCCECGGIIQKGESYQFNHGLWECSWASFKVCADCEALRSELDKGCSRHFQDLTPFEGLMENCEGIGGETFRRFVDIKIKRGADVPAWMRAPKLRG